MQHQRRKSENAGAQQPTFGFGSAMDLLSGLTAAANSKKTCSIHERCDGSCTGAQLTFQPLQSELAEAEVRISLASAIVPDGATPRDLQWSQRQTFQDFSYDHLDSDNACIRLLQIKPAIFRADIVECELITVSLNLGVQYNALSYTWGKPIFDQPILINGKKAMITAGLQSALKAYRQEEGALHDTPIWVDAVCINQKDLAEINKQLPLMKRIYSEAKMVFVDLGDTDESWYQGHDLMQKLCMAYEFENYRFENVERGPMPSVDEMLKRYRLPPREHPSWKFYAQIFGSPWFRRTWILQEVALATHAKARFGRFLIDWRFFSESFDLFTDLGMHVFLLDAPLEIQGGILAMVKIQELCSFVKREAHWSEFIHLLRLTNNFMASDPRDKVIGILGLIGSPRTISRLPFLADYSLTVDETYHRLALHLAEMEMTQLMLSHAGLHRRSCVTINAPSWVPDWTAQSRNFGPVPLVLFRPKLYQAATTATFRSMLVEFDSNNPDLLDTTKIRTLAIMGGVIDELACISESRPCYVEAREASVEESLTELMGWMLSARTCLEEAYQEMGFRDPFNLEAFARTLLVDDTYIGENATPYSSPITNVEDCYSKVYSLLQQVTQDPAQLGIFMSGNSTPEWTFIQQVTAASAGKRVAMTSKGRFCLVPACSQVGDHVGILLGANVPYILRSTCDEREGAVPNGQFEGRLIGDAYVDGMMDGEALQLDEFVIKEIHIW